MNFFVWEIRLCLRAYLYPACGGPLGRNEGISLHSAERSAMRRPVVESASRELRRGKRCRDEDRSFDRHQRLAISDEPPVSWQGYLVAPRRFGLKSRTLHNTAPFRVAPIPARTADQKER